MDSSPSKPPHQKLQNDVAGIDADFGSIYVIPAPTDYMDDDVGLYNVSSPHQLINFGPQHEKVLIIPDYRVNHVMPGVSRKPLIKSAQMVKIDEVKAEPSPDVASSPLASDEDLSDLLSLNFREKHQVTPEEKLTALAKFDGAEGAILLDMFESWNIRTLQDLVAFPSREPEGVKLLVEADLFPDIANYTTKVQRLLSNPPPLIPAPNPTSSDDQAPSSSPPSVNLAATQIGHAPVPILQVPGVTPAIADILSRYALLNTSKELADFSFNFPGIYAMLKDSGEIPNLDELCYAALGLSATVHIASTPPTDHSKLGSDLSHLGEAQRSTVKLSDVSKNTLVNALKGMNVDLASELATQYPPIHSLQALATFAEVNPTEYTYLKRKYPELPDLCQQAALLVSVASGQARPPTL